MYLIEDATKLLYFAKVQKNLDEIFAFNEKVVYLQC